MDVEEYITLANQQLKAENFYKKLNEDPIRKHLHCQQHHSKF